MWRMPQAPKPLPYRLRSRWDNSRIASAVAPVLDSPPIEVPAACDAALEVHLPVCRRDLHLALVAIKSLLRFGGGRFAVTFTDDGSLSSSDRELLSRHVPGARLWNRTTATPRLEAAFQDRQHLRDFYTSGHPFGPKLLHPSALTESPRALLLDSDTAFFRSPDAIWKWIEQSDAPPAYMHDHRDEATEVGEEVRTAFREMATVVCPTEDWRLGHYFFNAGLLAFRPQSLDLDLADRYLSWRKTRRADFERDPLKIWFGEWTAEQTSWQTMFALAAQEARPMGDDYWIGFDAQKIFCHFLRHYLIQGPTLRKLNELAKELRQVG